MACVFVYAVACFCESFCDVMAKKWIEYSESLRRNGIGRYLEVSIRKSSLLRYASHGKMQLGNFPISQFIAVIIGSCSLRPLGRANDFSL